MFYVSAWVNDTIIVSYEMHARVILFSHMVMMSCIYSDFMTKYNLYLKSNHTSMDAFRLFCGITANAIAIASMVPQVRKTYIQNTCEFSIRWLSMNILSNSFLIIYSVTGGDIQFVSLATSFIAFYVFHLAYAVKTINYSSPMM